MTIRRDVPFYMLEDLQSVVATVRKNLAEKAASAGLEEEEEEDDD